MENREKLWVYVYVGGGGVPKFLEIKWHIPKQRIDQKTSHKENQWKLIHKYWYLWVEFNTTSGWSHTQVIQVWTFWVDFKHDVKIPFLDYKLQNKSWQIYRLHTILLNTLTLQVSQFINIKVEGWATD